MRITKILAVGATAVVVGVASLTLGLTAAGATSAPAANASVYVPVNPVRVLDTRTGAGSVAVAPLGTNSTLHFTPGDVPAGATAVVLNVTATDATATSYLSVYPDGSVRPYVSQVTVTTDHPITDQVTVSLPNNGAVDVYNHVGSVNVVADLAGYYVPAPTPTPENTVRSIHADTTHAVTDNDWQGTRLNLGGSFSAHKTAISQGLSVTAGQWYQLVEDVTFHTEHGTSRKPQAYGTVEVDIVPAEGSAAWLASRNGTALPQDTGETSTIEADREVVVTFQAPITGTLVTYAGGYLIDTSSDSTDYLATIQGGTLTQLNDTTAGP